jgi:thiol-disulfide isomerase/thioredoxin
VVVLHFWATWCLPCLHELPMISQFAREMKPRGLEVLSLSLDDPETKGSRVGSLLAQKAPNLTPSIVRFDDPDNFINAIDADWGGTIPAVFAYDQKGQLRGSVVGETTREELDQLVAALIARGKSGSPARKPGK